MAPDRYELQRTQKKSSESFRTYAQRWRKTAAQVKLPMLEKEMVTTFLNTLKDPYYAHLIGHTTSSFADLVIVGERVEDGVKSGRLIDSHLLQTLMEQQSGTGRGPRKSVAKRQDIGQKNADIQMITTGQPPRRDFPQNLAVYVQPAASQSYAGPPRQVTQQNSPMTSQQPYTVPATQTVPLPVRESTQATSFPVTNVPRKLSTLPMTLSPLLPQLLAAKMITPIPPRPLTDPPPRNHNTNARCDYHMGARGHWTDRCYNLRHRVQDLIDKEFLNFEPPEVKPNVMQNALPTHVDDKPNSSSNSINDQEKAFDPSQLITLPGAVVRVWLDKEQKAVE